MHSLKKNKKLNYTVRFLIEGEEKKGMVLKELSD